MTRFTYKKAEGQHFTQQMCQDVLDFMTAAVARDGVQRRSQTMFDLQTGEVTTVGDDFDKALARLAAHFGLTMKREEPKPKGKRAQRGGK